MSVSQKYSRQREAIYDALMGTKEHPSAENIYNKLRPEFPNLSLATVYRNLALFKNDGRVKSVAYVNGVERYDADIREHSHFICESCGAVSDIDGTAVPADMIENLSRAMNAEAHAVTVYGRCSKCLENG